MSQHNHIATFANRRESAMTVFARPEAVDIAAIDAVRCGRQLSEAWLQTEVENTAALDPLLHETLSRLSEGEVFSKADDHTIVLMLAAVRQTLDCFRPNYGEPPRVYRRAKLSENCPLWNRHQRRRPRSPIHPSSANVRCGWLWNTAMSIRVKLPR